MGQSPFSAQAQAMQTDHDPNAAFPWWVRFLAKGLGIVGGFVAMFFAVIGLIGFSASCIIACFLQLAAGFLIVALEAPFCCAFVDFIERLAQFSESRAFWQKAAIYSTMGIIPILLCVELATLLGSGMILASGIVYGFMSLGKKADRNTMMGVGNDHAWSPQVNQPGAPTAFNQP